MVSHKIIEAFQLVCFHCISKQFTPNATVGPIILNELDRLAWALVPPHHYDRVHESPGNNVSQPKLLSRADLVRLKNG